ncbi:nucleoside-diphosphate kinase [Streptosporangium sp. NPDC049376]|uniref:nucleoside-diphosphate kinase n=1 Tax=Streptosporangium sp. NPDC049376 TaxID=3366192 RepID=UPI0037A2AC78
MPVKADLYDRETYFREGLDDVTAVLGAEAEDALWRTSLLIMKPDGLAAAKLRTVLAFLAENDFTVVAARRIALDRMVWRELWRYQLTSATLDRFAVNDHVLRLSDALFMLLRSDGDHPVPATVRLSGLKGSATLSDQRPGTLRHRLGQPNRVLSFLHVADEPADLVRELGLFFEHPARVEVITAMTYTEPSEADRTVLDEAVWSDARPARSLNAPEALERLRAAVRDSADEDRETAEAVLRQLASLDAGERLAWRALRRRLNRLGVKADPWDLALVGTTYIRYDDPDASKRITNPPPGAWDSH